MIKMCCYYKRDNKYINIIEELNIVHTTETIKDLFSFLKTHPKQRINLCISDIDKAYQEDIFNLISKLEERDNLVIRLPKDNRQPINEKLQNQLKSLNLPFYYTEVASDWDILNGLIAQGVTDVFVGNNLGFELDKVAAVAKQANVRIRVYPNVAQSTWNGSDSIIKFFIRPEDLILYSKYVDCFEIYVLPDNKLTNAAFLYETYKLQKQWLGDLQALIIGLREPIDNRLLDDQWGSSRIKCGKRCAKGESCHICQLLLEMSDKMSDKEKQMNRFLTKRLYS